MSMSDYNQRVILIPIGKINDTNKQKKVISYMKSIEKAINMIDDDITVKGSCEQVLLKKKKIQNFKGKRREFFHDAIIDGVSDTDGTTFLLFNN